MISPDPVYVNCPFESDQIRGYSRGVKKLVRLDLFLFILLYYDPLRQP